MKIALVMLIAVALSGCTTLAGYATCPNARAAVEAAQQAADALCPVAMSAPMPSPDESA